MSGLEVTLGNLHLRNPVMPASGTFAEQMTNYIDINQIGAIIPKSITKNRRTGNPTPRICETKAGGMINSIGIQSEGLTYFKEKTIPFYAAFSTPLIPSVSADSIEEFVEVSAELGAMDEVEAIELNISCPNLKNNGMAFGMDPSISHELVSQVRKTTNKPLIPKLSPNVTSIVEIAKACEAAGADILTVSNTFLAMSIDVHTRKPKISNVMGGYSGPAILPLVVRMVYQVYQATSLPIIGCGGVMNGEDAIELMLAGASAVQIGTASFVDPEAMITIRDEIEAYMQAHGIKDIQEIIGGVVVR
ncbi:MULTISPECIES: dihydroorotate dehydrogenase [Niallia]|jgi:dihydroorotate dehydrogenase (NAD+) catalytic subunit|uniref:dihydroorotate dehydrogenase n=1 Tax=Niallia TaxID=2837506 RepID=UPI002E1B1033|nr:dihydroorotate dehydrogenase [Niallia circulans]MED5099920.1 dihydroorotate dehydrogenase [Niallia circulans]